MKKYKTLGDFIAYYLCMCVHLYCTGTHLSRRTRSITQPLLFLFGASV